MYEAKLDHLKQEKDRADEASNTGSATGLESGHISTNFPFSNIIQILGNLREQQQRVDAIKADVMHLKSELEPLEVRSTFSVWRRERLICTIFRSGGVKGNVTVSLCGATFRNVTTIYKRSGDPVT